MSILKLAFLNVWRRLSYSLLSLVAMFTAAAVLTSALTLSQGEVPEAFPEYRGYFGGDILVYSPGFLGLGQAVDPEAEIAKRRLMDSGFNPALRLYPELVSGYYAQDDWSYAPFTDGELDELLLHPNIARVVPHRTFPGSLVGTAVDFKVTPDNPYLETIDRFSNTNLTIPWDIEISINAYGTTPGRPPTVLTLGGVGIPIDYHGPTLAQAGSVMEVKIPYFLVNAAGVPYVDHSREPKTYRALVSSVFRAPTREIGWLIPPAAVPMIEQGYTHWPDVYMSEDTWKELWSEHAGGADYPVLALSLQVKDASTLYPTLDNLRRVNPHWSTLSLKEVVERGNRFNLIDSFYQAPPHYWASYENPSVSFASEGHKSITVSLLYLNAGILLASQMLMAVASRKNEIGVLKAIGARRREVTLLILSEAVIIALIGSMAGFFFVKAASIHQSLSNNIAVGSILKTTAQEQGIVIMATVVSAIVFGALPAWRVSRLAVMEVFRKS